MKRRRGFLLGLAAGIGIGAGAVAAVVWWASGPSRKVEAR